MALTNNQSKSSGPLIFLTPRSKDKDGNKVKPYFSIARLVDGKIEQTDETCTSVSGNLIRVEVKDKPVKNSTIKEAAIYLSDGDANETYRVALTFSMSARGLFNSLAGLKDFNNLSVDIYENNKRYETYALKQAGEKTSWKHELSSLPAAFEMKDKAGKVVKRDYSEVDDFFQKELLEIAAKINKAPAASTAGATKTSATSTASTVTNETRTSVATPPPAENLDEDVPF
jgi:hypothetical protein